MTLAATLRPCGLLAVALLTSPVPGAAPGESDEVWFEEVGAAAGLDFVHQSGAAGGFRFPEIMGSGVALFDYDGDGLLDVYCVQAGDLGTVAESPGENPPNRLFHNQGDGTFVDVTDDAGVGHRGYGMGVACGDYDRDGDVDLYVTNVGPNVLYRNNGDGTFTDVTTMAKAGDPRWGTSVAFVDVDGNSFLDLFVVNNLGWSAEIETSCANYNNERDYCSPENYNAHSTDVLLLNNRRGAFQDVSSRAGILGASGNGLGLACGDYDLDGDTDIYVANDANPNVLWRNDGKGNFENVALLTLCAVNSEGKAEAGMGVQFIDVDTDGYLDLFMTHLRRESNTFYHNVKGRMFRDRTNRTGTNLTSLNFTGFGMGFQDFDLDGRLDLFVANGAVQAWKKEDRFDPDDGYAEPNHLYRGQGGLRFEEVARAGLAEPLIGTSRGAAFGDYDNDGDIDVVILDRDGRVKLLKNVAERRGGWIGFRVLPAPRRNKLGGNAIGATVTIRCGDRIQSRVIDPAYSYLSSNDPRVHFGLGPAEQVDEVRVRFAGRQQREEVYWRRGEDGAQDVGQESDAKVGRYNQLRLGKGVKVEPK